VKVPAGLCKVAEKNINNTVKSLAASDGIVGTFGSLLSASGSRTRVRPAGPVRIAV
jgi:hypothetical protein